MRINKTIVFLLITLLIIGSMNFKVLAEEPVQALQTNLEVTASNQKLGSLLSTEEQSLYGQKNTFQSNYSITSDLPPSENNVLHLEWQHSQLLISPSSVTVAIDNQPVQTVSLSEATVNGELKVALQKQHVTKGSHQISIQFYGVIKEGVCVNQNTTGNWFKIKPTSNLQLSQQTVQLTLDAYPAPFSNTNERQTVIVIPDQASADEVAAGLLMKKSVESSASNPQKVVIQKEGQIDKWNGAYIFVGVPTSWNKAVKDLLAASHLKDSKKDTLTIERTQIINGNNATDAMFVQADTGKTLLEKMDVLMKPSLVEQLAGQRMDVSETPNVQEDQGHVTLTQMGATDLYLSSSSRKSLNYYYPIGAFTKDANLTLNLKFRTSELIQMEKETNPGVELIVWVNNIPHPIALNTLKDANETWVEKELKVNSSVVKNSSFLSVSFEVTGLKEDVACIDTDAQKWVYISADSSWKLPETRGQLSNEEFSNWGAVFTGNNATIVIPDEFKEQDLQQLSQITGSIPTALNSESFHIAYEKDLTKDQLKDQSLIYLGGVSKHPSLKEVQDKLMIPYKGEVLDIGSKGFVKESSRQVAWIQPSPWNKGKALIVFDNMDPNGSLTDPTLLNTISSPNEPFSIAIKNTNGSVFTNSQSLKHTEASGGDQSSNQTNKATSWIYLGGFVLLLVLIGAFLLWKRKKRA